MKVISIFIYENLSDKKTNKNILRELAIKVKSRHYVMILFLFSYQNRFIKPLK